MIYAKGGVIIDSNQKKVFQLFNGKVINNDKTKINVFQFDQIDFNLADYSSNTIIMPKIQERSSKDLLNCILYFNYDKYFFSESTNCDQNLNKEINQELFKRFYKPLFIPIIALLCSFLIIIPKNNFIYNKNKRLIFLFTFFLIVFSEASLRYSAISKISALVYLVMPWVLFISIYLYFLRKSRHV